jgi:hypothetical protein
MSDIRTIDLEDMDEITINRVLYVRPHYTGFDGDPKAGITIGGRRYLAEEKFGVISVDTVDPRACTDPHVEANVAELRKRSAVGVKKYGTTLEGNKLPISQWMQHTIEELLDAANYMRVLLSKLSKRDSLGDDAFRRLAEARLPGNANAERSAAETDADRIFAKGALKHVGWRWRHKNSPNPGWYWVDINCRQHLPAENKDLIIETLYS